MPIIQFADPASALGWADAYLTKPDIKTNFIVIESRWRTTAYRADALDRQSLAQTISCCLEVLEKPAATAYRYCFGRLARVDELIEAMCQYSGVGPEYVLARMVLEDRRRRCQRRGMVPVRMIAESMGYDRRQALYDNLGNELRALRFTLSAWLAKTDRDYAGELGVRNICFRMSDSIDSLKGRRPDQGRSFVIKEA